MNEKLTPDQIHEIAIKPLPVINIIKWNYLHAGNRIFRESTNRVSNEINSSDNLRY